MTGHDGDVSPPSPLLLARAGPISVSSSAPGGAGRSMRRGKELVLAGSSSAATVGSPPPPTNILYRCSRCRKKFSSPSALNGHKRVHNNRWDIHKKRPRNRPPPTPPQPKQQVHEEQDVEAALNLLMLGQGTLKKIKGKEMKGDGSAVAEGGASSSVAAEGQRKTICMEFDLTKKAAKK